MSQQPSAAKRTWTVRSGADLGHAIADVRALHHLTQSEAAERAGLSRDYVAQIEAGRSARVLEHAIRLLRRLGASVTITLDDNHGQA
ncbi:MAG: helix-turn-helix transcriptional regulator [Acidimicrobiia bacterium]|nr:helix-turn-helix transcriptional regulator [Acidimicrobiia bacterium]